MLLLCLLLFPRLLQTTVPLWYLNKLFYFPFAFPMPVYQLKGLDLCCATVSPSNPCGLTLSTQTGSGGTAARRFWGADMNTLGNGRAKMLQGFSLVPLRQTLIATTLPGAPVKHRKVKIQNSSAWGLL